MSRSSKLRIANRFRRFVETLPAVVLAAPAGARVELRPPGCDLRRGTPSICAPAPRQPQWAWTYPTRLGGARERRTADPRGHGRDGPTRARAGTPQALPRTMAIPFPFHPNRVLDDGGV